MRSRIFKSNFAYWYEVIFWFVIFTIALVAITGMPSQTVPESSQQMILQEVNHGN